MTDDTPFDSILLVSFGGPEGPEDVMPFLENVLRGKNVPRDRMLEVAEHYQHFGGVSPINEQNRTLIDALKTELQRANIDVPVYWGNRNWHPLLPDALRQMAADGRRRALAFFTSMFSCYSGCRQYRENIADAQKEVGTGAPAVQKVRMGFNHPRFIEAQVKVVEEALDQFDARPSTDLRLLFTAHSIPMSMADHCRYVLQLRETAQLVAAAIGEPNWELVYQSRSGPPQQPWLEPDICDRIEQLAQAGVKRFVAVPIGFISDHMEVLYDLDTEARDLCANLGVDWVRAGTVATQPAFVTMIRELIEERLLARQERPALGDMGASHDVCPVDCCLYPRPQRPAART